ncbi:MAG: HD domain-containing protein [Bacteriovoracaceae bacterium]|nr:HD domain-containing protein [Bacteriovoracaceae bacterium]
MRKMEYLKNAVAEFMGRKFAGHDTAHILRVYQRAMHFCDTLPAAKRDLVAAAALLHDCDDYKLFGEEAARTLPHARQILAEANLEDDFIQCCTAIISTVGYNKRLRGIKPLTLEGEIVADADMSDAIGALGIVRCIEYGTHAARPFFDPACLPGEINAEKYQHAPQNYPIINHFFDKLLRLRDLCLTPPGRAYAAQQHQIMVDFLQSYFTEVQAPQAWHDLLAQYA